MDTDQSNSTEEVVNAGASAEPPRPTSPVSFEGGSFNYGVDTRTVKLSRKNGPRNTGRVYDVNNGRYTNARRVKEQLFAPKKPAQTLSVGDATLGSFTLYEGDPTVYWQPSTGDSAGDRWLKFGPTIQDNGGHVKGEFNLSLEKPHDSSVGINANYKLYARVVDLPYEIGFIEGSLAFDCASVEFSAVAEVNKKGASTNLGVVFRGPTLTNHSTLLRGVRIGNYVFWPEAAATCGLGYGAAVGAGVDVSRGRFYVSMAAYKGIGCQVSLATDWSKDGMPKDLLVSKVLNHPTIGKALAIVSDALEDSTISPYRRAELEDIRDDLIMTGLQSVRPPMGLVPRAITNGPGDGPQPPPGGGAAPAADQPNPHVQFNIFPDDWQPGDPFIPPGIDDVLEAHLPPFPPPRFNPDNFQLPGPFNLGQVQQLPATPDMMLPFKPNPAFMVKPAQGGSPAGAGLAVTTLNDKPAIEGGYTNQGTGTTGSVTVNTDGDVQGSISQDLTVGAAAAAAKLAPWALVAVAVVGFVVKERKNYQDRCDKAHENRVEECRKEQEEIMQKQHGEVFAKIYQAICSQDFEAVDAAIKEGESIPKEVTLPNYADLKEPVTLTFDYSYQPVRDFADKLAKQPKDADFHLDKIAKTSVKSEEDWESQLQIGYSASFVNSVVSDLVGGEYYLHAADLADKLVGNLKLADNKFIEADEQRRGREDLRFSGNHQVASIFVGQVQQLVSSYIHQLPENYWKSKVTLAALEAVQIAVPTAPTLALLRLTADPEIFSRNVANYVVDPRADLYTGTQVLLQGFTFFLTYADSIPIPRSLYVGSSKNRRWWSETRDGALFCTNGASRALSFGNAASQLIKKGLGIASAPMHAATLVSLPVDIGYYYRRKWDRNAGHESIDSGSYRRETAVKTGIGGAGALGFASACGAALAWYVVVPVSLVSWGTYKLREDGDAKLALDAARRKIQKHQPGCDTKLTGRRFSFDVFNNEHPTNGEDRREVSKALQSIRRTLTYHYSDRPDSKYSWDGLIYREEDSERSDDQSPSINDIRLYYLHVELDKGVKGVERRFPCLTDDSEESANPDFTQAWQYQNYEKEQFNRLVKEYQEKKEGLIKKELLELREDIGRYFKGANAEEMLQLFADKQYKRVIDAIGCEVIIRNTKIQDNGSQPLIDGKLPPLFGYSLILRRLEAFATSPVRLNEFKDEYDKCVEYISRDTRRPEFKELYDNTWSKVVNGLESMVSVFLRHKLTLAFQCQDHNEQRRLLKSIMERYNCCDKYWHELLEDEILYHIAVTFYHFGTPEDKTNAKYVASKIRDVGALFSAKKKQIESKPKESDVQEKNVTLQALTIEFCKTVGWLLGSKSKAEWLLKLKAPREAMQQYCDDLIDGSFKNDCLIKSTDFSILFDFLEKLKEKPELHIEEMRAYQLFARFYADEKELQLDVLHDFLKIPEDARGVHFWYFMLRIFRQILSPVGAAYPTRNSMSEEPLRNLRGLVTVCMDWLRSKPLNRQVKAYVEASYDEIKNHVDDKMQDMAHGFLDRANARDIIPKITHMMNGLAIQYEDSQSGERKHFIPSDVPHDGDCAFRCLGIKRGFEIAYLRRRINVPYQLWESGRRKELTSKIYHILLNDLTVKNQKPYPQGYLNIKPNLEHINKYLDGLAQPGVWLSHNQTSVSVFDALAYVQKKNLHIYQVSEEGKLILANNTKYHQPDFEDCHVLYSEGHYLRLKLFSAKVEELHDREHINIARNPNAHFAPPQAGPADEGLRQRRAARAQVAA